MTRKSFFMLITCILTFTFSGAFAVSTDLVHHWNLDEGTDWYDDSFRTVSQAVISFDSVGFADAGWLSYRELIFKPFRLYRMKYFKHSICLLCDCRHRIIRWLGTIPFT